MRNLLFVAALLFSSSFLAFSPDPVSAAERPHILLAIADDWSYGHAGAYGCPFTKTPAFDRVAKQGLLFTRAYTPNAKCAPSRACLLTGRNSWQLKDAANHVCYFPPEFKSYPEALAEAGYFVGYTTKGWGPGIAKDVDGTPRQIAGQAFNSVKAQPPASGISGNDYAGNFAAFLEAAPADQPWCFWYGAIEPHRGYQWRVGIEQAGKRLADVDRVPAYWPDNETTRTDLLDYAFEVEHFDRHLGRMLKLLEERGALDDTLVIVTSDHGMPFPRCKGQAYHDSNHVPLAIRWPRGIERPGRTVDALVSFIDFAPTLIEAAGLEWEETGLSPTPGRSLRRLFSGESSEHREFVLIGKERHDIGRPHDWGYPIRGVVTRDWLYLHNYETDRWPAGNPETGYLNCDGSPTKSLILERRGEESEGRFWELCFGKRPAEELFRLATDPDCVENLADSAAWAERKKQLATVMERELKAEGDPRMFGRGEFFDRIPYANKGHRDFHRRYLAGEKLRAGWVRPSDFQELE